MSKGPTRKMVVKMTVLMVLLVFVAFGTVLGQLVNIQFINGDYYQEKAINQQLRTSTINAARGTIYDLSLIHILTLIKDVHIQALIERIIEDEEVHLSIFRKMLECI